MQALDNVHLMYLPVNTVVPKSNLLTFTEEEKEGVVYPSWDPLVISAKIMRELVHHIMVDNGAFYNIIIFKKTLVLLGNFANYIDPCELSIRGFRNQVIQLYGMIHLVLGVVSNLDTKVWATR